MRNESGEPPPAEPRAGNLTPGGRPAAEDPSFVLPYQRRSDGRLRRTTSDLFAGVAAVLVLAISASGLVMTQVAGLSGWLRGYAGLYATATVLSLLMVYWSFRVARFYFQGAR